MSEDIKNDVAEQQENSNEQVVDSSNEITTLKQQLAEAQKSIEALASKKEELLKETKAAKDEKRRQAEAAEQAKLEAAQKNGEFEKLWKHAEDEKNKYKDELTNYQKSLRDQAINVKAEKLALELTNKDPDKAELLKDFIAQSLSNVADEKGHADEDVLIGLKSKFEADKKYALLIGVNKSSGGSAQGNTRSAGNTKEISRSDFDTMPHKQRKSFLSGGGKLID